MRDMTDRQTIGHGSSTLALDLVLLALFGAGLGLLAIQPGPNYDELYHVLAARSWAEDGSVAIADGYYTRAILFTKALGLLFSALGGELQTAKLLPLSGSVLLLLAIFCWVRATFGRLAAWITVILFALTPGALYVSQFVRFYSWHALAIWLFAIAFYGVGAASISWPKRALLGLFGLACWALAYHLQPTTLIATVAIGLWLTIMWGPALIAWILRQQKGGWMLLGLGVLLALMVAGLAYVGFFAKQWANLRNVSPWQDPVQNNFLYYHIYFLRHFPTLWSLLPVALLFAIRRNPGAALLCGSMILVAFSIHSVGGSKSYKYLHYAIPFFFVLWGAALAEMLPVLHRLAGAAAARLSELVPTRRRLQGPLTFAAMALVLVFILATNSAFLRSAIFVFIGDPKVHWNAEGWRASAERLRPIMDEVDLVATSNGLFAIYYLGRYDIDISPSQVAESTTGEEFGRDERTGSYVISKPESLALLMACHQSGLYVNDSIWRWRKPHVGISDEMADFLDARTEAIELPEEWMLRAYRWERPEGAAIPENCPDLSDLVRTSSDNDEGISSRGAETAEAEDPS